MPLLHSPRVLSCLLLATLAATARAESFSYDYLEAGFGEVHPSGDLLNVGGSLSLDKRMGVTGSIGLLDYNTGDGTVLRAGGFLRIPQHRSLDFYGAGEIVATDFDFARGKDDDYGLAVSGGVRYALQDNFHFEGKILFTQVEPFDDGIGLSVAGRYYIDRRFSVAAGLATDTEYDGLWLNLRMKL